jgi:hypothetical protein
LQRERQTNEVPHLPAPVKQHEHHIQKVKNVRKLTWVCALFLHDLAKGHRGRRNETPMFSTFGFTLGLVPNVELDLGAVVCIMAVGGVGISTMCMKNEIHIRVISL